MSELTKIFKSLFKFLSSLKLAVVVILSLAYVLAMGTIYESLYGTAIAKEKVYGTWWFTLVLFFLGVNVLCAALSRLPWKRHHIGFVVTHAGIITILIGSVLTQKFGIDGSLPLAEGEEGDRITLDDPLFQVMEPDQGITQTWKARFTQNSISEEKPWVKTLKDGSKLSLDRFYLHSQVGLNVTNDNSESNPALKISLTGLPMGGDADVSQWLFSKETDYSSHEAQLGPAKISLVSEEALKGLATGSSQKNVSKMGTLQLSWDDGKTAQIEIEKALKEEQPLLESDLKIKALRYLPDARVVNNQLVSKSDQPNNPAVEFKILKKSEEETHVVFANFPDLEAVHGAKASRFGVKALFLSGAVKTPSAKGELYLALGPSENILYRIRAHGELGSIHETKVGEEVPTGWMTIRFKVAEYLPKAQVSVNYRKVAVPEGKSGPPPAVHFIISKAGKSTEGWMQQGDAKEAVLGGVPYLLRYGLRASPLGFSVRLKKFEIGRYMGTDKPSSFASLVEIKNEKSGESFESNISMNEPLDYRGYKFYQASYQEEEGSPTISILSVGKDPGTPIKYTGSILLVGGIALMFWFKPLFVQKRMAARCEEKNTSIGAQQAAPLQSKI